MDYIPLMVLVFRIDVYTSNNALIGTTGIFNPCTNSQTPITITTPAPPTLILVDVDFSAKCQGKNLIVKPSAWVSLYDPKSPNISQSFIYSYIRSGKATVSVYEGREYTFGAYYGGKYYSGKITFNKNSSECCYFCWIRYVWIYNIQRSYGQSSVSSKLYN